MYPCIHTLHDTHTQFVFLRPFLEVFAIWITYGFALPNTSLLPTENTSRIAPLFPPDKSTQIFWTPNQTGWEKESTVCHLFLACHIISIGTFQDEGGELILVAPSITDKDASARCSGHSLTLSHCELSIQSHSSPVPSTVWPWAHSHSLFCSPHQVLAIYLGQSSDLDVK